MSERAATVLVWDLPVRLFHWTLAALIAFSWWSAEYGHVDWHIWSGCAILTLLIFRVLWGLFGSSTARFANFVRGPSGVLAYLRNSEAWRGIGHSPLGALSVLALLLATAVQVVSAWFRPTRMASTRARSPISSASIHRIRRANCMRPCSTCCSH